MSRFSVLALALLLAPTLFAGQAAPGESGPIPIGPGVTPPRIIHKVEPEYSPDARNDHVQGTVVLAIVIDEQGRPSDVTVVSPLGYGLDERAIQAVEGWRFAPGLRDGKPVKIAANVEVKFRYPEVWFNEKAEYRRTLFNVDLQRLARADSTAKEIEHAIASMQDLARQKFAPAMYTLGLWETTGNHVAKNPEDGLALIEKAAASNYGPALYEIALRRMEGRDLPKDVEKGMKEIREAATLGSPQAQFWLGARYETGDGVPRELDRAGRYFRLCAVKGISRCEYRLGRLLLDAPSRPESDYLQAVALLQLAGEGGVAEAKDLAAKETPKLTPTQSDAVSILRDQLVRK